ncbi:MAG: universal stress protein [Micropruina sp.]|nr:MAG: universal stress protein [Micropruina sp.]
MDTDAPVVIGNDGSDFAEEALRRGLWLARNVGAPAHVLRAWTISTAPVRKPGNRVRPPAEDFEAAVRERLEADVAGPLADYPDVPVTLLTPHGAAGRELVKASEKARVIVVGTRGLGGFQGLLMGSVSDQVVEHALCDVLVVRSKGEQSPGRRLPLDRVLGTDG